MKAFFSTLCLACGLLLTTNSHADTIKPEDLLSNNPFFKEAEANNDSDEFVVDLLINAVSLIGIPYRYGGNTPATGMDCSGFLNYIFKQSLTIKLPRTAAEIAKVGNSVSRSDLKQGDLVLFNTTGQANSHIGLYMGNDQFIHAPRTGRNISIESLNNSYWKKHYTGARRIKP
ncbi:MAG: C40 family peptidase [Neisseriaceae bacterium]|nr:C40 family peptidase [Neisseriaceae bacterium]